MNTIKMPKGIARRKCAAKCITFLFVNACKIAAVFSLKCPAIVMMLSVVVCNASVL